MASTPAAPAATPTLTVASSPTPWTGGWPRTPNRNASAPGADATDTRTGMDTLRASGEHTGGPSGYSDADRREFANALDRWLARQR
ncbi:DUF188 domain-containing protein [Halomonas sp. 1390]|uniref:DUF188 domain-containing protein n=1 Tax=Halomonas sp. B23F22_3 TaxID=3459516 RepID=UPI00373E68AC